MWATNCRRNCNTHWTDRGRGSGSCNDVVCVCDPDGLWLRPLSYSDIRSVHYSVPCRPALPQSAPAFVCLPFVAVIVIVVDSHSWRTGFSVTKNDFKDFLMSGIHLKVGCQPEPRHLTMSRTLVPREANVVSIFFIYLHNIELQFNVDYD